MKNLKLIAWSLMIAASSASYADGTMLETATKEVASFATHCNTRPALPFHSRLLTPTLQIATKTTKRLLKP